MPASNVTGGLAEYPGFVPPPAQSVCRHDMRPADVGVHSQLTDGQIVAQGLTGQIVAQGLTGQIVAQGQLTDGQIAAQGLFG